MKLYENSTPATGSRGPGQNADHNLQIIIKAAGFL